MILRQPERPKGSEITPPSVYLRRREWMLGCTAWAASGLLPLGRRRFRQRAGSVPGADPERLFVRREAE
jgi:hypothetical protein